MEKYKKALVWLWLSVLIVVFDQKTKYLVSHYLSLGQPVKVFPFLNFTLNYNNGALFGFLGAESGWQVIFFAVISLIVSIILIVWLSRLSRSETMISLGCSLIIGGAIGNFIDRALRDHVTDFIDFYIKEWHFSTFNVADSAICVGVFLVILHVIFASHPKH